MGNNCVGPGTASAFLYLTSGVTGQQSTLIVQNTTTHQNQMIKLLLSTVLLLICISAIGVVATADVPSAGRPDCLTRCGDVDIPFPFGIDDQCAIHHGFNIVCKPVNGTNRPFKGPLEVTKISVRDAKAWMKVGISWQCYDSASGKMKEWVNFQNFTYTPFRFSYEDNKIFVIGCNTMAYMRVQVPILVYEFIPNGTLSDFIHRNHGRHISLFTRLRIAHESAEALAYLHSYASPPIIHGDVKSSNILLDVNLTAKVSDFGASILAPIDKSQLVTLVQGTWGYLDPEYMQTCQLTDKSDVYSFGVVLLELLTRKSVFNLDAPEHEKSLSVRFLSAMKENRLVDILDDQISNNENMEFLEELADLAKQCLSMCGENRPSMKEVAEKLDRLIRVMQHPWAQQNPEEIESLLEESSHIINSRGSTGNFSIDKKAVKSLESGR
ncbi:hypothetical protein E2562_024869 [Oryza meyeriana var. granulata]|uniref:Protein kinase domain-containing protein n=1 Tax=Oryza meyeriana var. granulata TaxID=110450 RepID=A0A6G1DMR2_9ORYZ|nr:hypothetical protein E2562_024869 [Oryza meyeriana var. granulata]